MKTTYSLSIYYINKKFNRERQKGNRDRLTGLNIQRSNLEPLERMDYGQPI